MKIININRGLDADSLLQYLQQNLNQRFQRQKNSDIIFTFANIEGYIEIWGPEIYEGFLFRIKIKGTELHITRSEHYVDDVNSLTLESIINQLFEELSGDNGVALVLEG